MKQLLIGWVLCFASLAALAETVTVHALVDGQIVKQNVKEGDRLVPNQVMFVIDPSRWQAKIKRLQAQVAERRIRMEDLKRDLDEKQDLYDRTVLAKRPLQRAQAAYDIAKAQWQQAKAELEEAQAWRKYYYVPAPHSSIVNRIYFPKGTNVFRGSALIKLEIIP